MSEAQVVCKREAEPHRRNSHWERDPKVGVTLKGECDEPRPHGDTVNHPAHYQAGGMEAIDVIEAFGLGFNLGNAVKYLLRAGRKGDAVEDLRKAAWYLEREIGLRSPDEAP